MQSEVLFTFKNIHWSRKLQNMLHSMTCLCYKTTYKTEFAILKNRTLVALLYISNSVCIL